MRKADRQQRPRGVPEANPEPATFQEVGRGILRVRAIRAVHGKAGRIVAGLHESLIGRPLATAEEPRQRVGIPRALPVLASDNMSSSAYATEELTRVLVLAGAGALALTMPLSVALVCVLAIVVFSYSQVIRAYPFGGGSYSAAKENLGRLPGLVAAASLIVDYVLTVAVSVAAGVAALTSAFPGLHAYRVPFALLFVATLVMGNLRGVRESARVFSVPTYLYILTMFGLIGYGLFRLVSGTMPEYSPPSDWTPSGAEPLGILLILRAFSSGAVALTGVEAVSNGMRILHPPEAKNASVTLVWMGLLFASIFLGISFLASRIGVVPDPNEQETVISQIARLVAGEGSFHLLVQAATALILVLAANTAFVDFPRLSSVLARDRYFPKQFLFRGRRLAFSTGIVAVGALAALFIVVFRGSVAALIPLYTIGVFVAFSLSQAGM
ncbi:MAG: APC family permease, partial [Chloroflexi bacterium]|nr:APC family permease [Chloroflexota bacterium]